MSGLLTGKTVAELTELAEALVTDTTAGQTIRITPITDIYIGTAGDDTFNATRYFNEPSGTFANILTNQWEIDGKEGDDTINISVKESSTPKSVQSIETVNFTVNAEASAAITIGMGNFTGITSIGNIGSQYNLTLNNIQTAPSNGLWQDADGKAFTVTVDQTQLTGTSDSLVVTVSNLKNTGSTAVLTAQPSAAGSGYEEITINATGLDSAINQVTQGNGTSLSTLKFSGDKKISIAAALDSTVTTVDATAMTDGGATLTAALPAAVTSAKGGAGDDYLNAGANFSTTNIYNGGDGADTLATTSAKANSVSAALTNVSNIQELEITDAVAANINVSYFGSAFNILDLKAGSAAHTFTLNNNTEIFLGAASTGTITLTAADNASASTVTLTSALTIDGLSDNAVAAATFDNLTLNSKDTTTQTVAAITLRDDATTQNLNFTGLSSWTVSGAISSNHIDASGLAISASSTGLVMQAAPSRTVNHTITGSKGNDTIIGSLSGHDTIDLSEGGDDIFTAQDGTTGKDKVTFGTGDIILDLSAVTVDNLVSANKKEIIGFKTGTYVAGNDVGRIRLGDVTAGDLSDGAGADEWDAISTPTTAITMASGVGVLELSFEFSHGSVLSTDDTGTTLLAAAGAASGTTAMTITTSADDEDLIIIAYQNGDAYMYHGNGGGTNTALVADEIELIGVYKDVAFGTFDASEFIT